jgi:HEAT repeats
MRGVYVVVLLFIPKFACALSALTPMRRCSSLLSLSICLFGAWAIAPAAYAQAAAAKSDGKWQIPAGIVALAGGAAGLFYLGRRTGQQGAQTATQNQQTFQDYDRIFQADETPLSFSAPAPAQAVVSPTVHTATVQPAAAQPAAAQTVAQTAAQTMEGHVQPGAQPMAQTVIAPASQQTAAPVLEAVTPSGHDLPDIAPAQIQTSAIATTTPAPLVETQRIAKGNFIDELIKDLQNHDPTQRRRAIWDLSQRGDTRAVQPLVDLMIDSDSKQRSMILSALSEIGTRTLKPMSRALAISLQDESPDVRKNAIRDLTRVYDLMAQISQMVHQATEDPDSEVRETAQWALKQMNRFRVPDGSSNLKTSVSPPESLP